jgi:hypothetical protein
LVVVNEGQARKARTEIKRVPAVKKEDVVTKDAEEESEESSEEGRLDRSSFVVCSVFL